MASLAAFIFLVVIPIWSVATMLVRWIEAWGAGAPDASAYLATREEMARRIALLESVVKGDRSRATP